MENGFTRIGLRMFSEGRELSLTPEEKKDSLCGEFIWYQETKCPHCNKGISIRKWIEKWKAIKL